MQDEFKPFTYIIGPEAPDRMPRMLDGMYSIPLDDAAYLKLCPDAGTYPSVALFHKYQREATKFGKRHASVTEALSCESLGLCGEAGEVADHIKKHLGHGQPLDVLKLAKELGDVLWYVQKMCTTLGIGLSEVAALNIQKLSERHPTGKFDPSYHATGETESEREHDSEEILRERFRSLPGFLRFGDNGLVPIVRCPNADSKGCADNCPFCGGGEGEVWRWDLVEAPGE